MAERPDEPKASDLLPEPEPAPEPPRKLGTRRVAGWATSDRLLARGARRPVGNSRGFWQRIEEDDPFARRRPKQAKHLADHDTIYPTERLARVEGGKVVPARPRSPAPPPKPRGEAKPRPAPKPPPQRADAPPRQPPPRQSQPTSAAASPPRRPPMPAAKPAAEAPIDRRPPVITPGGKSKRTGRVRIGRQNRQSQQAPQKTAAQIRAEKEAARKASEPAEPPKLRNMDGILSALGNLAAAQAIFEENKKRKDAGEPLLGEPAVTPDPRPAPPPPRPTPRAATPSATPAAKPPPVNRTPPKPTPPSKPKPAAKPASAGGMDDLFGGGPQEGRVRIGRRSKPKTDKPPE